MRRGIGSERMVLGVCFVRDFYYVDERMKK